MSDLDYELGKERRLFVTGVPEMDIPPGVYKVAGKWKPVKHDPEGSGGVLLGGPEPLPERPPNRAERRRNRVGAKARGRAYMKEIHALASEARNAEARARGEGTPKGPISRWIRETGWRPPGA